MPLRRHIPRAVALAAAVLVTPPAAAVGVAAPSTAREWLDAVAARLLEVSGRAALLLPVPGHEDTFGTEDGPVAFVFHAPLSTMWVLDADSISDAERADVRATAVLLREETADGGRLRALWRGGAATDFVWPLPVPELDAASERHPLAVKHDLLLSAPLARPVAGLPAGWRFFADGLVLPDDPEAEVETATLWRSDGDRIVIEHADGRVTKIPLDELIAAISSAPATTGDPDEEESR